MGVKSFLFRLRHWETWHYHAKYIPLSPAWLWYCLRSGSFWFFTPSNPTLTFGGFEGESKKEMYDQLPPGSYPYSMYLSHLLPFEDVLEVFEKSNLKYPFAAKPNVGMMGFLFRAIRNEEEFRAYHEKMPADYIIQELVTYPIEVSVFYYRYPNSRKGNITGFLKKESMHVTGNGSSTLLQLIENYPRAKFRLEEMKAKHVNYLQNIIADGKIYPLSYALNLSRGGRMISLAHEIDDQLLNVFDELSLYTGNFYYGRYDIKCQSVEDLKNGRNYSILEYNGSGAEPHHVYGNNNTLLQAYRILLKHWQVLFEISRQNRARGIEYWSFFRGYRFLKEAKKYFKMLKELDASQI